MLALHFREATQPDFPHLLPLLHQLWPGQELDEPRLREAFCRGVGSPDQIYLVAQAQNEIVGFGSLSVVNSLWVTGNLGHINELVVEEAWRGRGIGTRLLDELIAAAKARGCRRVELDSAFHREEAHRFYEARGFRRRALWFTKEL